MKKLITIFLTGIPVFLIAQNLVPNPGFETYLNCPTAQSMLGGNAIPWITPLGSGTTPDYFNACSGFNTGCLYVDVPDNFLGIIPAFEGDAYAGIIAIYDFCPNCREYVQVALTSPLIAGTTYLASMRIRLGSNSRYATNKMGMYLSVGQVMQPSSSPITGVTPQAVDSSVISDTSSWTLVAATFIAAGGEDYLTIGNFNDNSALTIDTVGLGTSGCGLVDASAYYIIDSVNVYSVAGNSLPSSSFSCSDTSFCDKQCIDFTDMSTNTPTSWLWLFPGADTTSSTLQNPSNICYNAFGSFDVTLIACNGAGCDTLFLPSFITEYPLPPQPVISQSSDTMYCTPASSYTWYESNNPGTPLSNNSFYATAGTGGSYFVIVTDSNGCQNVSSIFTATGIHGVLSNNPDLVFSPNPVIDLLTLNFSQIQNMKGMEVCIVNMIGEKVFKCQINNPATVIDLSSQSPGIYFIRISTDEKVINKRFILQH